MAFLRSIATTGPVSMATAPMKLSDRVCSAHRIGYPKMNLQQQPSDRSARIPSSERSLIHIR